MDVSFSYGIVLKVEFSIKVVVVSFQLVKFVSVTFSSLVTGIHVDQGIFDQAKLLSVEFCTLLVTFCQLLQCQALS